MIPLVTKTIPCIEFSIFEQKVMVMPWRCVFFLEWHVLSSTDKLFEDIGIIPPPFFFFFCCSQHLLIVTIHSRQLLAKSNKTLSMCISMHIDNHINDFMTCIIICIFKFLTASFSNVMSMKLGTTEDGG